MRLVRRERAGSPGCHRCSDRERLLPMRPCDPTQSVMEPVAISHPGRTADSGENARRGDGRRRRGSGLRRRFAGTYANDALLRVRETAGGAGHRKGNPLMAERIAFGAISARENTPARSVGMVVIRPLKARISFNGAPVFAPEDWQAHRQREYFRCGSRWS